MPEPEQKPGSRRYRCRVTYSLEVARQAAHLESTLHTADIGPRVRRVVSDFEAQFGAADVRPFLRLLCQALEVRGSRDAEVAVRREMERLRAREMRVVRDGS
ncbi:protein of unknown function [Pararobbsia alpina]|uniref:hypothetical protein n=1 Tax=Pararobbsia alpina TaxID=621374 RepID=UPI0039A412AA